MIYIKHRVNRVSELATVDPAWGTEIDLRSSVDDAGQIHLSHDPWAHGNDFEDWIRELVARKIHGPVILNTKEDGLEPQAMQLLKRHGFSNYFFLDTALPTLIKYTQQKGVSKFAVRVSRCEPVGAVAAFRGKAEWAWIDCFDGTPLPASEVAKLKPDFKICLVSPELQVQPVADGLKKIPEFRELFALADAICTKAPEEWEKLLLSRDPARG